MFLSDVNWYFSKFSKMRHAKNAAKDVLFPNLKVAFILVQNVVIYHHVMNAISQRKWLAIVDWRRCIINVVSLIVL